MSAMASQMTSIMIVYSTVYSGADQRKYQSSAPLAFLRGIHRWPVNSPHKGPVTRKMFPFDDVISVTKMSWISKKYTNLIIECLYKAPEYHNQQIMPPSKNWLCTIINKIFTRTVPVAKSTLGIKKFIIFYNLLKMLLYQQISLHM